MTNRKEEKGNAVAKNVAVWILQLQIFAVYLFCSILRCGREDSRLPPALKEILVTVLAIVINCIICVN